MVDVKDLPADSTTPAMPFSVLPPAHSQRLRVPADILICVYRPLFSNPIQITYSCISKLHAPFLHRGAPLRRRSLCSLQAPPRPPDSHVAADELDEVVGNVVAHPRVSLGRHVQAVVPVLAPVLLREAVERYGRLEIEGVAAMTVSSVFSLLHQSKLTTRRSAGSLSIC